MTLEEFHQRVTFQGGCDRILHDGKMQWQIIDVHKIPVIFRKGQEVDFYCCHGLMVFFLRLRNQPLEQYHYIHTKKDKIEGRPPYLIAECPVYCVNDGFLLQILSRFYLTMHQSLK